MTIQEILKRALHLLGTAEGAPALLPTRVRLLEALDSAVGELARVFPLQARCRLDFADGEAPLPETVLSPRVLLKEGKKCPIILSEGRLLGEDGPHTLVYYRVPPLASEMEETAALPYPEDILRALPFYCAALCVVAEDPNLYSRLMEQYNTKLAAALGHRPAAGVEGGGCL